MQTANVKPNQFLWAWVLSAIGVYPVVGIACVVVWSPVALLLAILGRFPEFELFSHGLSFLALLILPALVIGYFVGDFQQNLLRDYLHWNIEGWQKQSLKGAVLGGILFILSGVFADRFLDARSQWLLSMPVFVFALSSLQWWRLREYCRDAWLWVLANVVAGIMFTSLLFFNTPTELESLHPLFIMLWWAIAAGAQGLVTGIIMLYLYERPLVEDEPELAPVYIEVRNREDR